MGKSTFQKLLLNFVCLFYLRSNAYATNIDSLISNLNTQQKPDTVYVNTLNEIAKYYMEKANDSCLVYGIKANRLAKSLRYFKAQCRALSAVGSYYNSQSKYELALQYFVEEYKVAESIKDKNLMSSAMNSIGNSYLGTENSKKALEAYKNSYDLALADKNERMIGVSSIGIGHIYLADNEPQKALDYYRKANVVFKKSKNIYTLSISHAAIANALFNLEKYTEAFAHFDSTIALAKNLNDTYVEAGTYNEMGDALLKIGKNGQALSYFLKSMKIFEQRKAFMDLMNIAYKIANIYKGKNDYKNALEYYTQHNNYKDSVFSIERNKQLLEVATKYETEKKEKEIGLNKLKLKEQQTASNYTIIIIVTFFIVALIIFLFYHTSKLHKEKLLLESTVEKRTKKLKESLDEREFLLKEVHHRVKNNLTLLKSLLFLQAKATNISEVKILLEECQLRIQSMAIIHQNLMEESDTEKIEFQSFLTQLFTDLETSFTPANKKIDIEINCDNVETNMSVAIILGLIINELATNSYKYAFVEKEYGKIGVKLSYYKNNLQVIYFDTGVGLPNGFDITKGGFGFKLLSILTQQINATINYEFENNQSKFMLTIPNISNT